jgi:hypothetical protein
METMSCTEEVFQSFRFKFAAVWQFLNMEFMFLTFETSQLEIDALPMENEWQSSKAELMSVTAAVENPSIASSNCTTPLNAFEISLKVFGAKYQPERPR